MTAEEILVKVAMEAMMATARVLLPAMMAMEKERLLLATMAMVRGGLLLAMTLMEAVMARAKLAMVKEILMAEHPLVLVTIARLMVMGKAIMAMAQEHIRHPEDILQLAMMHMARADMEQAIHLMAIRRPVMVQRQAMEGIHHQVAMALLLDMAVMARKAMMATGKGAHLATTDMAKAAHLATVRADALPSAHDLDRARRCHIEASSLDPSRRPRLVRHSNDMRGRSGTTDQHG